LGKFIDLTGQKFDRLTVIKRGEDYITPSGKRNIRWLCKCACDGKEVLVLGSSLKKGNTRSCGCLMIEKVTEICKARKKYNIYDLSGEYGIGYTTNNEAFYFDLEDYDLIKDYCWSLDKHEYLIACANINREMIKMHRLVMNCPDDMDVDHIYHDNFDNRKTQLRMVTKSQNQMNRKLNINNTSGVKGVYWDSKNQKWQAQINIDNKRIHLGRFNDINDAINARKQAEEKYFGEYNFKNKISM
jgi:phosphotransferase system IIB component